jgi:hypothetical protein
MYDLPYDLDYEPTKPVGIFYGLTCYLGREVPDPQLGFSKPSVAN